MDLEQRVAGVTEVEGWLAAAPEAKRLFILHVTDTAHLDALKRLRGIGVGQPILVLMPDAQTDKAALIQLMRAGADQAVLLPLEPDDFRSALASLAWQFGFPADSSPVVAVTGPSAGSGVTTVALNLAYELAHRGRECLLVEMSTCRGKLAGRLGVQPRFTSRDLAEAEYRLDAHMIGQALVPVTEHLRLLAAPSDQLRPLPSPRTRMREIFTYFRQFADVTVLDMASELDQLHFSALAAADQVVVVGRQAPSSLQDLKLLCQMLRRDYGILALRPVINAYDARDRDASLEQLREALAEPQLWTIAFEPTLAGPRTAGQPLRLEAPRSIALADVQAVVGTIVREPKTPRPKASGWLGWLTGAD